MAWSAGVPRSAETRAKMSAASKAAWADQRSRVCDLCQARGVGGKGTYVDRMLDEDGEDFFACRDIAACDARFTGVSEERAS